MLSLSLQGLNYIYTKISSVTITVKPFILIRFISKPHKMLCLRRYRADGCDASLNKMYLMSLSEYIRLHVFL